MILDSFRQKVAQRIAPTAKNAAGVELARDFLRHGNRSQLMSNWAQVGMSDKDMYTGYLFGAIHKRANGVVELAENNLMTKGSKSIMDAAKRTDEAVRHPYLDVIDESDTFQNDDLWYNYSTYMDLEGVFYLIAVRNVSRKSDGSLGLVGNIQYLKLISPYNMVPVRNEVTKEIGGYTEYFNGLVRDWPVEMVIPIRRLNPFSDIDPFSIADAAKDDQFTLKSAKDYTNNALAGNINAPGIISTGVELPPSAFENFRSRVVNHEKGEPLFGNGSGKIDWKSMQSELEKAALDKINEISLTGIIATTGASKTALGLEVSGVTRDTAKVQHDQFVSDHTMPQLRKLLGAFNQDYRRYYPNDYKRTQYALYIDNPLGSDRDAEIKDVEISQSRYDLYTSLLDKGYESTAAARYASGEITLAELGEPTKEPDNAAQDGGQQDQTPASAAQATAFILAGTVERLLNRGNPYHGPDGKFTTGGGEGFSAGDISEADTYIDDSYGSTEYSDDEKVAISSYTMSMFGRINRTLRGNGFTEIPEYKKKTTEAIKLMDSAMKKVRLKEPLVLYRGAVSNKKLKKGDIIKDKAYSSTSLLPSVARRFVGDAFISHDRKYKYVLKLTADKGQNGIFAKLSGRNSGEAELILPKGRSFTVTNLTKKDGYYQAEARIS